MTLRAKIEAVIAAAEGNSQKAAMGVCVLLENEIGLSGNGWFDGDDALMTELDPEWNAPDSLLDAGLVEVDGQHDQ